MEWNIGNVKIKNQIVLAPMAGICNSAYRQICKDMGCGLIYAEMVSDKAISYNNKKGDAKASPNTNLFTFYSSS